MKLLLEERARWKLSHVTRDPDPAPVELQEFDLLVRLVGAEDQADRRLLARLLLVLLEPAEIELHLAFVRGLEGAKLQLDRDQPPELAVVEEEIEEEVLPVDD